MKRLALLPVLVLTSVACGTETPTQPVLDDFEPQFAKVRNEWVDYTGYSWWNDCTNESMITSGQYHSVINRTDNGSGGWHYFSHLNMRIQLVGETSGDVYKMRYNRNYHWTVNGNNPQETNSFAVRYAVRSKTGQRMVYTWKDRFTVNANGDVTVSFSDFGVICK
jgi:hypothetical protein